MQSHETSAGNEAHILRVQTIIPYGLLKLSQAVMTSQKSFKFDNKNVLDVAFKTVMDEASSKQIKRILGK